MVQDGTTAGSAEKGLEISREEIIQRMKDGSILLVSALPRVAFEEARIPGSINLPVSEVLSSAGNVLPDRTRQIAVYCGGPT